jgi:hypothetical protein
LILGIGFHLHHTPDFKNEKNDLKEVSKGQSQPIWDQLSRFTGQLVGDRP